MALAPEWLALAGAWTGTNAFRMMPDEAYASGPATLTIESGPGDGALVVRYTWTHEDSTHQGLLVLTVNEAGAGQAVWLDTFHQQPSWMELAGGMRPGGRIELAGTYAETWGWRISLDPTDGIPELVMDNVPPGAQPYPVVHLIADPR